MVHENTKKNTATLAIGLRTNRSPIYTEETGSHRSVSPSLLEALKDVFWGR